MRLSATPVSATATAAMVSALSNAHFHPSFRARFRLLDGICTEAADALKDTNCSMKVFDLLRRMTTSRKTRMDSQRAGRPAPGNDFGGRYRDDVFHVFGQIVSGYARLYAATGEARLAAFLHFGIPFPAAGRSERAGDDVDDLAGQAGDV